MKVLVTGVKGQLGYDVRKELAARQIPAVGVDIEEMDVTREESVRQVMESESPDAVIHCAAYTAVDAAQDDEELCRSVNVHGTRNLAAACKRRDIPLLYLSTDYVFDGQGEAPWKPEDEKKPLNIYGQTKYEGELAIQNTLEKYFIVRISWVFGRNGRNFVQAILNRAKALKAEKPSETPVLSVVSDQFGSPTYTYDLAKLLADMIVTDRYGVYHASNEGICSWYEFACEVFRQTGMEAEVKPVGSGEYPVKASRPFNSRMDKSKLDRNGFRRLPPWQDALGRYLREIGAKGA
ncbi:MAG: dTDP-4-dehydrorhamnose reductase [Clostridium sp.]|jgi:dTDP-4-dehydrorhamnose reductase|nr:dTDP-4-dehydrorhamnose reductase [Clostridium sp.]